MTVGMFDFLSKTSAFKEISGNFGEWLAKIYAKSMPGALVLHDVLIDGADGYTSQIDLLIVGNRGIYVVEVKNFPDAKIYGDISKTTWYYYNHGKKYEIYSPVKQNKKHVEYLKRFLADFGEFPFFSVVTMICDDFKVSGEFDGYTVICSSFPAMEKGMQKIAENNPIVYDNMRKKEIFEYIKNYQYIGKEARAEHKQNVIAYKETLEEKKRKICPRCKASLVIREGKNGKFYGCSNFPKCRFTTNVEE